MASTALMGVESPADVCTRRIQQGGSCGQSDIDSSTLDDGEARHYLEVANVACCYPETELQRGRGDQQVFESDGHTVCSAVPFDAPGELGRVDGDRMNGNVPNQL